MILVTVQFCARKIKSLIKCGGIKCWLSILRKIKLNPYIALHKNIFQINTLKKQRKTV